MASSTIGKILLNTSTFSAILVKKFYAYYLSYVMGYIDRKVDIHPSVEFRSPERIHLGKNSVIKRGTIINGRSINEFGVFLGPDCYIKEYCYIDSYNGSIKIQGQTAIGQFSIIAGQGGIEIGKYVMLGAHCYILSSNHRYSSLDVPYILQGDYTAPVKIEDNVWIGGGSIVMAGVTIGRNSVIGAGSIVTKSIPPNTVYADRSSKMVQGFLHRKEYP